MKHAAVVDPWPRRLYGEKGDPSQNPYSLTVMLSFFRKLPVCLRGDKTDGKHHEIKGVVLKDVPLKRYLSLTAPVSLSSPITETLLHVNRTPGVLFALSLISFEPLAVSADVVVKDMGFQLRVMFLAEEHMFDRIHAADRRAVGIACALVPRTDALNPGDLLGMAAV